MANASIFSQYLRPVKSVGEFRADMDQSENNALALAAKRLQMQQTERGIADEQAMRDAYRNSGGDSRKYRNALQQIGNYQAVQQMDAADIAKRKEESVIGKNTADVDEKKLKMIETRLNIAGQAFGFVKDNPSADNAAQAVRALVAQGIWDQAAAAKAMQEIQANPTPEGIRMLATRAFQSALSAKEQLPQFMQQNRGGTQAVVAASPVTGQVRDAAVADVTQSPDNAATQATSTANSIRNTGAMLANAQANRDAARITADGNRDAAKIKWNSETEMKLGDDYRAQSKDFREATSAYKQISASLDSATKSPAATLAAATKFMKILDPGSVVRESELGMALAATGVIDRMSNYMNTLKHGKVLTANQVADFKDISAKIYGAAQEVQRRIDADYANKAKTYGLRSEMVTQDIGQNDKLSAPAQTPAPAGDGWSIQRMDK